MPVALPGPEEKSPAKDAVGPVLPLNAIGTEKSSELLGAAKQPAERQTDPLATRVLNRGEAIAAPRGRADDFSWPRASPGSAPEDTELPDAVPPKGSTETKPVTIKADEAKKHPTQSAPASRQGHQTAPSR